MKKIIIIILIFFSTFIIYKANDDNLIDYMNIGDSISLGINSYGNQTFGYNDYLKSYLENNNLLHKYNSYYSKKDYKITELINDIDNNKTIIYDDKSYNIKKELREADLITISIGMDNLIKIFDKDLKSFASVKKEIDNMCYEMESLIKNIKSLSKNKIVLIGYYNPYQDKENINKVFEYINKEYERISNKYSIIYINIDKEISYNLELLPNINDYHLISKGYLKIANKIIKSIENDF